MREITATFSKKQTQVPKGQKETIFPEVKGLLDFVFIFVFKNKS